MNEFINEKIGWTNKVHHPADYLSEHWQEIGERYNKPKELSISFLPELDNRIWGLKRRQLVIVAGRPSQGKSTLMLSMAYDFAKQNKTIYFFTLEMTKEECLDRIICNYYDIDNFRLQKGDTLDRLTMEKMGYFYEELKKLKLIIIESWGKKFEEILEIMNNFEKPDAVFIDYVNLIKQISLSKKDSVDEYIKDVRQLALDRDFCAILGAQINRDVHRQTEPGKDAPIPNIWNLKESGSLEEIADKVFIVHWPHFYRANIPGGIQDDKNEYIIKVAKNRSGRTGVSVCNFFPEFYRITERKAKAEERDRGID